MSDRDKAGSEALCSFFAVLQDDLNVCLESVNDQKIRYALQRQRTRARKRARIFNPELRDKAISDFKSLNSDVDNINISLSPELIANSQYFITKVLEDYTKFLEPSSIQETLDLDCLFDFWRFGPGASNGVRGTHTAEKIQQKLTCTSKCVPFVKRLRLHNPYFRLYDEEQGCLGYEVIRGSRLATVQKNEDTDRTIAIEPSGNMAIQLAAGAYLEGALKRVGLDISCQQDYNNLLALSGSMTGGMATIDLKSASDMFHIDLVRMLMPRDWFILLTSIRSEEIELPDGSFERLNMISTMGNGFTFPLMSLIILSLIYAYRAINLIGKPGKIDWSETSVFGDDIIVPTSEFSDICEVLRSAGLVVNTDKSYCDGPFRESCGGDYYEGYNVTPFYIKSLMHDSEIYVALNQLLEWSARHNVWLIRSFRFLLKRLGKRPFLVPEWRDPSEGILTAQCPRRYKILKYKPRHRRLGVTPFDMMLAVGGYVSSSGLNMLYTPRPVNRGPCSVEELRLPKGFLSGWDPIKRSQLESSRIATFVAVLD